MNLTPKTCVIPIAGLGTRLLPLTKVIPKAMLPVAGKPCVQWIVEEVARSRVRSGGGLRSGTRSEGLRNRNFADFAKLSVEESASPLEELSTAGIKDIIFVYSKGQEMVREYFAEKTWYEEELMKRGKIEEAKQLEAIRNLATFHFVEQDRQMGDGHAILQAKKLIGDEPFLVIFGDCLYRGDEVVEKLKKAHHENKNCVIAVQQIASEEAKNFGIAEISNNTITSLIEKPDPKNYKLKAKSSAIIGRYLLTASIWKHLEKKYSDSGEIRLIDALQSLLNEEEITAVEMKGKWLDTGTREGLEKATIALR